MLIQYNDENHFKKFEEALVLIKFKQFNQFFEGGFQLKHLPHIQDSGKLNFVAKEV